MLPILLVVVVGLMILLGVEALPVIGTLLGGIRLQAAIVNGNPNRRHDAVLTERSTFNSDAKRSKLAKDLSRVKAFQVTASFSHLSVLLALAMVTATKG